MARQVAEVAPGVSEATFNAHTHNYRKITQLGVDAQRAYNTPQRVDIVDDSEVNTSGNTGLEAVGITVVTTPTGTPV